MSRLVLLWGAPLSVLLQARPVKMWIKVFLYSMSNPPSILLSLLPAPQQAIMSFDMEGAYNSLYGKTLSGGGSNKKKDVRDTTDEGDDDVEGDVKDEDEFDLEEEDDEEDATADDDE